MLLVLIGQIKVHKLLIGVSGFLLHWGWVIVIITVLLTIVFDFSLCESKSKLKRIAWSVIWCITDFIRVFPVLAMATALACAYANSGMGIGEVIFGTIGLIILMVIMSVLIWVLGLPMMFREVINEEKIGKSVVVTVIDIITALIFFVICRILILWLFPTVTDQFLINSFYGNIMFLSM